jgi:hypothetical protein
MGVPVFPASSAMSGHGPLGGGNNSQAPGELALAATFTRHSDSSIFWRAV